MTKRRKCRSQAAHRRLKLDELWVLQLKSYVQEELEADVKTGFAKVAKACKSKHPRREATHGKSKILARQLQVNIRHTTKKHSNSHVVYNRWFMLPFYRMQEMPRVKFGRHM